MLINFKVASDSPALVIEKQNHVEKSQLRGIYSFKMHAVRTELDTNSFLLMSPKYIQLPKLLYSITLSAIGDAQIFYAPFDIDMLMMYGGKFFRQFN